MFDVITIGSATRDVFLMSRNFKLLHQNKSAGAKIEVEKVIFSTGGGATNAAVTFSRQGLKTATIIKTGKDMLADYILDELKKEKISSFAVKDNKKGTDYSTILIEPSGERTVLVYYGASRDLEVFEIPFNKIQSKWAYIAPGDISFSTIEKIFSHLRKNKTLIAFSPSKKFIDMGLKKLKPLFDKTEVLILNLDEAAALTGISVKKEKEIFAKLDRAEKGIAVMTKGKDGAVVSDGKNIYRVGIFPAKVIDRTGAGDAFASGFVSGLIYKGNIKYAIRLGSANATAVVGEIGAKDGILAKQQFENESKWKNLTIKITKI